MEKALRAFTQEQVDFLAALAMFERPISIVVLGQVIPLLPGPFIQLLDHAETQGWIIRLDGDRLALSDGCPRELREEFDAMNTAKRANDMIDRLSSLKLLEAIEPEMLVAIYNRAGCLAAAIEIEVELTLQDFQQGDHERCLDHLRGIMDKIPLLQKEKEQAGLELATIIVLSDLCFTTGTYLRQILPVLQTAVGRAAGLGDQRAWALCQLHIGRLYYVGDRRREAMEFFSIGKQKVEELGDEDIIAQASEFIGIFYFMQGLFAKAIEHFGRAEPFIELENRAPFHTAAVFLGFSAAYAGQFHKALGILDSHWHLARQRNNHMLATVLQAALGTVLLSVDKPKEAQFHLKRARQDALETHNLWAIYIAGGGLAYYHVLRNQMDEAVALMKQYRAETEAQGIVRQFASPHVIEMMAALEQAGYEMGPEWRFDALYERTLAEPNIHLRGVVLRLHAATAIDRQVDTAPIAADLEMSEHYLSQSGDPVQLAKTHIEMARLKLRHSDLEGARKLVHKARRGLAVTTETQFPDGLRFLLEGNEASARHSHFSTQTLEQAFQIIEELIPRPNFDEFLTLMVSAMSRLFKAERCGVFWLEGVREKAPQLRAACNIYCNDVVAGCFAQNRALILQSFRKNQPLVSHVMRDNRRTAVLCLPFAIRKRVRGVLYLDNAYLDNCFDAADAVFLAHLSDQLGAYFERIEEYSRFMQRAKSLAAETAGRQRLIGNDDIYTQNTDMRKLLAQASRIAKSGAKLLILGETGVGKEVLARWIHQNSHRDNRAMVVIDATAIPENLVESDLFGHEKGAFTGADTRKVGRLELAHGGTLFIDEIGEISEKIQVKLLRVLQDKTFMRVGGTKVIASDFRLIAATNRDLGKEVEAGRFRKDLYYRLNVMELRIPPLRERKEDIVYLARHFLSRFARRHNRPNLKLSPDDETFLINYAWPGNIRELKNVVERAVLMSEKGHLTFQLSGSEAPRAGDPFDGTPSLEEMQRRYISMVLEKAGYRVGRAAGILKMKRTTLYSRMKKLGIQPP